MTTPSRFRSPAHFQPLVFTVAVLGLADCGDRGSCHHSTILSRWARGRLLQETWPAPHTCGKRGDGAAPCPRPCPLLSDPRVPPISGFLHPHLHTAAGSTEPEKQPWRARGQSCRRDSSSRQSASSAQRAGLQRRMQAGRTSPPRRATVEVGFCLGEPVLSVACDWCLVATHSSFLPVKLQHPLRIGLEEAILLFKMVFTGLLFCFSFFPQRDRVSLCSFDCP